MPLLSSVHRLVREIFIRFEELWSMIELQSSTGCSSGGHERAEGTQEGAIIALLSLVVALPMWFRSTHPSLMNALFLVSYWLLMAALGSASAPKFTASVCKALWLDTLWLRICCALAHACGSRGTREGRSKSISIST
jgi:hypothetical protein